MTTHTPTIAEQAQAHAAESAARLPANLLSVFATEQAALDAGGVPTGVATPGTLMPDAELLDANSEVTTLGGLRGDRPAVVVLYRGLTERNVDGQTSLPMPTVVVVDDAGVIRWIDVHPNYATRSEVPDILAAVDAIL